MPNSRANKDSRSMMEKVGDYISEVVNKPRKADDLVEEESMGGKIKKAKDKRREDIEKAMYK